MKIKANRGGVGFTLVEMMIVVAVIGLLLAIAVPNFMRTRVLAQRNLCINNLRVISDAKESWGWDKKLAIGARARKSEINVYIHNNATPKCPTQGTYLYHSFGTDPNCTVENHDLGAIYSNTDDDDD